MNSKIGIISAVITMSALLSGCVTAETQKQCKGEKEIGLQLYSLRDAFKKDYDGALKTSGAIGYNMAEAAGYKDGKFYGQTPAKFKKDAEAAGMKPISSHAMKNLDKDELASGKFEKSLKWWDEAIAAHKAAGMKFIVMPAMPHKLSTKDLKTYCDYYNQIGKKCADAGLSFGYHNHAFEFEKIDGDKTMFDFLLENTDSKYVFFEMDVYWVVRGQHSPVEYLKKYPNRFRLLHIKDDKELGASGMVGFDAIFNNLNGTAVEAIIVEVERYNFDPAKSCEISYNYLKNADFVPATYGNK